MADAVHDERSLPPTARRIEDARRSGQVAFSRDLVGAAALVAGWSVLMYGGGALVGGLVAYVHVALARAPGGERAAGALGEGMKALIGALVWPVVAVAVAALVGGVIQTRGRIIPLSRRIAAMQGGFSWRRPLGRELAADVVFDVLKIGVLLAVAVTGARSAVRACVVLPQAGLAVTGRALTGLLLELGTRLVVAVVVLAAVDYGWRVLRHRHRLRMSRQEALREERDDEGSPELKAERRRLFGAMVDAPLLAEVGTADLLVVEPGVRAVAVAWRHAPGATPMILARAAGPQLPGLERVARQAGVALCVDPALARVLALTMEGGEIPARHYGPLARAVRRSGGGARGFGEGAGRDGRAP